MNSTLENFLAVADAIKDQDAALKSWKSEAMMLRRVLAQAVLTNGAIRVDPSKSNAALSKMDDLEFGNGKVCFFGDDDTVFNK